MALSAYESLGYIFLLNTSIMNTLELPIKSLSYPLPFKKCIKFL